MKWFVYIWNIVPEDARMLGPFDSEELAVEWREDHWESYSDYQCAGVMGLPFTEISR